RRSPSAVRSRSTGSRFATTTKSAWFPFAVLSLTSPAPRVLGRGPRVKPYRVSDEHSVTAVLLQAPFGRLERTSHAWSGEPPFEPAQPGAHRLGQPFPEYHARCQRKPDCDGRHERRDVAARLDPD